MIFKELTTKDLFIIDSKERGPNVCIIAGVHGNELPGIRAITNLLLKNLKIKKGKVTFLFANPAAIKKNVRFVEENLNRCFLKNKKRTNSYEERLSDDIKKILNSYDICLDLHASNTPKSKPFIICEKNANKVIDYLPVKLVCCGFDKIQPGGTDYYMNLIGKIGICLESGYINDKKSIVICKKSILSVLSYFDLINYSIKKYSKVKLKAEYMYLAKTDFILEKQFKDFEKINKDQLIGFDNNEKVFAKSKGRILFPRTILKDSKSKEAFLFCKEL